MTCPDLCTFLFSATDAKVSIEAILRVVEAAHTRERHS